MVPELGRRNTCLYLELPQRIRKGQGKVQIIVRIVQCPAIQQVRYAVVPPPGHRNLNGWQLRIPVFRLYLGAAKPPSAKSDANPRPSLAQVTEPPYADPHVRWCGRGGAARLPPIPIMCACGCFLVVAVLAALVYSVMHGLWLLALAVLIFSAAIAWFGKKAMGSRSSSRKPR
jgi:hypothetical protein